MCMCTAITFVNVWYYYGISCCTRCLVVALIHALNQRTNATKYCGNTAETESNKQAKYIFINSFLNEFKEMINYTGFASTPNQIRNYKYDLEIIFSFVVIQQKRSSIFLKPTNLHAVGFINVH